MKKEAWAKFCRRGFKVGKGRKVVASRQTATMNGEGSVGELGETNRIDTRNIP